MIRSSARPWRATSNPSHPLQISATIEFLYPISSGAHADLQFAPGKGSGSEGWRNWPSATRLQASGCYAHQVDGTTFSEVIVFRGLVVNRR